ncbi:hypothetical protein CBM2587_B100076 [Cupriavidus taiwanensis]|uniref:Uncharacterized protein n=1 Tax=Cupriavidus taiwanensis TaxID=164546 RepID=A0A375C165_9BURK|nr:hypothetical protein CBM2587_B100076 [Cupriavidus taiwanensis]
MTDLPESWGPFRPQCPKKTSLPFHGLSSSPPAGGDARPARDNPHSIKLKSGLRQS